MKHFSKLFFATSLFVAACGQNSNHSKVDDIATPGPIDANNQLYWHADGVLYVADCIRNEIPVRDNCKTNIKTIAYDSSLASVNSSINANIAGLQNEKNSLIQRLLANHPAVLANKEKIKSLETSITAKKGDIDTLTKTIDTTLAKVQKLIEQILDYDLQIRSVNEKLTILPGDATLLRLKETLLTEQRAILNQKSIEDTAVVSLQSQRSIAHSDLSTLERNLAIENDNLAHRLRTLNVENEETQRIDRNILSYQSLLNRVGGVFQKIMENPISYRLNQLSDDEKTIFQFITNSFYINDIRMTNGYLEVKINSKWGGICDDNFDANDGRVLCRMIGKTYAWHSSTNGPDNFVIDDLSCSGSESNVAACTYSRTDDCGESENVKLVCQ